MTPLVFGLVIVGASMVLEQWRSATNEARLRARGAIEAPGDVFAAMRVAYPGAFAVMAAEAALRGAPPGLGWLAAGAAVFAAGKAVKYWAIAALGDRWSFRVLTVPGVPLVADGPDRFVRHPNYVGVMGELLGAWLWWGAWAAGPLATGGFGLLLWMRSKVEDRALDAASSSPASGTSPR